MTCIFFLRLIKNLNVLKKTYIYIEQSATCETKQTKTVLHFIFNIHLKNITLCYGNWCTKTMHTSMNSIGLYEYTYNIFLLYTINNVITIPQRIRLLVAHGRKWKWHVFLNEEIWIHFEISWAFCTEQTHLKNQEGEITSILFFQ